MVLGMALLIIISAWFFALPVYAGAVTGWGSGDGSADSVGEAIGLGNNDPRQMAASVINVLLGFLGIIAVIIILLGGFKWMASGGNDDKVGESKKMITAGIIGLIIILSAFAISSFVLSALLNATGAQQ